MKCFLCGSAETAPVPFDLPADYPRWFRCRVCGSDAADDRYDPGLYGPGMSRELVRLSGGVGVCRREVRSNCEWFGHHHELEDDRTFLDVGCGDGAGLDVMAELGWSVHGWDVVEPHYAGPHVTVAPVFSRWLFPRRYAAALCREVIEHCPTPDLLLYELHGATLPGGLVQVQTPVPMPHFHEHAYRHGHLFLASPGRLREMLAAAMLDVIDGRTWEGRQWGQAYLCRARR